MAQQQISNGTSGAVVRNALNSNFTELYNDKANRNHASNDTTFGVASTTTFGHIKVTSGNGLTISNGVLSLNAASQAQAIAGTATDVVMTPAATKQAINALGVASDGNLIIKVGGVQPTPQTGKTILWVDTSS